MIIRLRPESTGDAPSAAPDVACWMSAETFEELAAELVGWAAGVEAATPSRAGWR